MIIAVGCGACGEMFRCSAVPHRCNVCGVTLRSVDRFVIRMGAGLDFRVDVAELAGE